MLKKYVIFLTRYVEQFKHTINGMMKKCINIGCGSDIRPFWINCDIQPANQSIIKFDITSFEDLKWLGDQEADLITCNHVIGYLTIAQADNFFRTCHRCLNFGGSLIIEFPDLKKLLVMLSELDYKSETIDFDYIEIIRAIYAYDNKDAMLTDFDMKTYITAWSTDYLIHRLELAGFKHLSIEPPQTHDKRLHRDTRIEAFK